jgi:hypothetical protein
MRVFLDTNIVIDVLLDRPGWVAESEAVILRCEAVGDSMFIAWHGLATAYYLLKRGRTEAETMLEVDKILSWAHVAETSDASARHARSLDFGDFEDALQAAAAESCASDWIVTRNKGDFAKSNVPVLTPQEFLQRFPQPVA